MKVLVLNGPNLNMLGYGEGTSAGEMTLTEIEKALATYGVESNDELELVFYQTNHEGQLVDMVQKATLQYDALIFNPSALCHYSYILQDAVKLADLPVVEVHLENLQELEEGRRHSVISSVCDATFMGKGLDSYKEALNFVMKHIQ